jgi:Male sterility protein
MVRPPWQDFRSRAHLSFVGFDSLLSIRLRSALLSVSKKTATSTQPIPRNIVYTYPSVNALAAYLLSRSVSNTSDVLSGASERIRDTIAKYSTNFIPHQPGSRRVDGKVIALTGSTGSAGSSILALLLKRSDVKRIYLLNRKGNERQDIRQAKGFKERGLNAAMLEEKERIIYLDIDLARSELGLADMDYQYVSIEPLFASTSDAALNSYGTT